METGAHVMALVQEGDAEMASIAGRALGPAPLPEFLAPIVCLVPFQTFTCWLAVLDWQLSWPTPIGCYSSDQEK
ncbi:MAG: hypothetical protein ACE5IG_06900 [Dehalococcoidia bacterium]